MESLRIGGLKLDNPFVLAPLAGFTDKTMRTLCELQGASLTFTEMVSGKGLKYGDRKTRKLLELTEGEICAARNGGSFGAAGYQLFGDDPEILGAAAHELAGCDNVVLDLNCGCPVPKIVKNGEGAALLRRIDRLYDCVAAMVKGAHTGADNSYAADETPKPVTVKIRKGFAKDDNVAAEAAKAAEAAGAAAVTVHGRTREQYYEGNADWQIIADVKKAVNIPVIGNGDVRSGEDAMRMMYETGCDGVMIARGALGYPWIFRDAVELWKYGERSEKPLQKERINMLMRHFEMLAEDKGEDIAVREIRKFIGWYTKGIRGAAAVRRQANSIIDAARMAELFESLK